MLDGPREEVALIGRGTATMFALAVLAITVPTSAVLLLAPASAAGGVTAAEVSPCTVTTTHLAAPERVVLGDSVGVTLTVQGFCPPTEWFVHVVFVLDGSEAMAGSPHQEMTKGAKELIDAIEASKRSDDMVRDRFRYGVVSFADSARHLCPLTEDPDRAKACVNRVGSTGGARLNLGIVQGMRTMRAGRSLPDTDDVTEILIVAAHGAGDTGCYPALQEVRRARSEGVLVVSKCETATCDEQCIRQVAASPRYYFRSWEPMPAIFQRIYDRDLDIVFMQVVVTETLSSVVAYVPQSAQPSPEATGPSDLWLRWKDVYVPKAGVTYTYRARPLQAGRSPVSDGAIGHAVDTRGRVLTFAISPPAITVTLPTETTTPLPSPTATAASTASAAPTASPTSTNAPPSETPTPVGLLSVHLPWARR